MCASIQLAYLDLDKTASSRKFAVLYWCARVPISNFQGPSLSIPPPPPPPPPRHHPSISPKIVSYVAYDLWFHYVGLILLSSKQPLHIHWFTHTHTHTHLHTHTVTDPLASVRILTLPWQTYSGNRYKNLHLPSWAFNSFTNHLTLPSTFMPGHGPSRRNYQDQDKVYPNPSLFWISPTKTHHKNVKFNINNNKVGGGGGGFLLLLLLSFSSSIMQLQHNISLHTFLCQYVKNTTVTWPLQPMQNKQAATVVYIAEQFAVYLNTLFHGWRSSSMIRVSALSILWRRKNKKGSLQDIGQYTYFFLFFFFNGQWHYTYYTL